MENKTAKLITSVVIVYNNCNDCPSLTRPDENREIKIFDRVNFETSTLTLSEKIYHKGEFVPNPCIGFCEKLHKRINDAEFPIRKTDKTGFPARESAYHTHDGKCIMEHHVSNTHILINL
jgi:hypothetical protein